MMDNKLRNIFLLILLLTIMLSPVAGLTRTITDLNDSYYTLIRNTKGHCWDSIGSNVQVAINDLGGGGGTVYVGSDIVLSDSIILKNYCIVDFLGNKVTLQNNKPFVNMSSDTSYATVRNVHVRVSDGQTSPVIYFYAPLGLNPGLRCKHNTFENIYIENPSMLTSKGEWSQHNYTGICYLCEADNSHGSAFYMDHFENIHMEGPGIGIKFSNYGTVAQYPNMPYVTHYINGEYFKNIFIDEFVTAVSFNVTFDRTCNDMVFDNFIAKTASFSRYGIMNVSLAEIDFSGGVLDWGKAVNPVAEFSTDVQWDYPSAGWEPTYYLYANWNAPYNPTYMTDIALTQGHYNFLIASGHIRWHS